MVTVGESILDAVLAPPIFQLKVEPPEAVIVVNWSAQIAVFPVIWGVIAAPQFTNTVICAVAVIPQRPVAVTVYVVVEIGETLIVAVVAVVFHW